MRTLLLVLLAFGLGVYVGKPAQVTLQAPECENKACPYVKSNSVVPAPPVQKEPDPTPSVTPSSTPSPSASAERDDNTANASVIAAQPNSNPDVPSDEKPILDGKTWAKGQIDDIARMAIVYPQMIHNFTFSSVEYAHIDDLRAEIAAQGLIILEEGAPGIGKFVWAMKIVGPNYHAESK